MANLEENVKKLYDAIVNNGSIKILKEVCGDRLMPDRKPLFSFVCSLAEDFAEGKLNDALLRVMLERALQIAKSEDELLAEEEQEQAKRLAYAESLQQKLSDFWQQPNQQELFWLLLSQASDLRRLAYQLSQRKNISLEQAKRACFEGECKWEKSLEGWALYYRGNAYFVKGINSHWGRPDWQVQVKGLTANQMKSLRKVRSIWFRLLETSRSSCLKDLKSHTVFQLYLRWAIHHPEVAYHLQFEERSNDDYRVAVVDEYGNFVTYLNRFYPFTVEEFKEFIREELKLME